MSSVRPRSNPAVLIKQTDTLDGTLQDPEANAQVAVLAIDVSGDGDLESVSATAPLSVADASPTLEPIGAIGATVPIGGGLVIDSNGARLKIDIMNPNAVRVWLGLGQTAEVGVGNFVDPGGCFTEYTTSAVYSVAQDDTEHTVCGQEWGA